MIWILYNLFQLDLIIESQLKLKMTFSKIKSELKKAIQNENNFWKNLKNFEIKRLKFENMQWIILYRKIKNICNIKSKKNKTSIQKII